ncbi:MAG: sigma-70 family RNA polymerase sigma factor [Saprospiraceae bacterium]|nr:sigma-70 family RNA polymerase sigma factor [Saprospiraceae bacterium]
MQEFSDNEILNLFRQENTRNYGFNLLVKKYQERTYWHIRRIVIDHEDANDVTQNVFIKIWSNLDNFRLESKLFSWIYRIATNEALTFLKNKHTNIFLPLNSANQHLFDCLSNEETIDCDEIQLKLQHALLKLPNKQRIVFNMRYYDEMSYGEMSEVLETSKGALKASYHHAIKKIGKYLKTD